VPWRNGITPWLTGPAIAWRMLLSRVRQRVRHYTHNRVGCMIRVAFQYTQTIEMGWLVGNWDACKEGIGRQQKWTEAGTRQLSILCLMCLHMQWSGTSASMWRLSQGAHCAPGDILRNIALCWRPLRRVKEQIKSSYDAGDGAVRRHWSGIRAPFQELTGNGWKATLPAVMVEPRR
jgi:hypothetical protein